VTLRHRSALRAALSNRDEVTLQPILKWLVKNIRVPRYVKVTTDVGLLILDIYGVHMGLSPEIDQLVEKLHNAVRDNVEISQQAINTIGMMDLLVSSL
jgi:U3 small nucleolar RNA-associated protein 15